MKIPMAEDSLQQVRELFDLYDTDADNSLTLNELAVLLQEIGNKITALPAVRSSFFRCVDGIDDDCGHSLRCGSRQRRWLRSRASISGRN